MEALLTTTNKKYMQLNNENRYPVVMD